MRKKVFRLIITGILMLGLAIPGAVSAGGGVKQCSVHGTWFGVDNLDDKMPTGWVVTATGQSAHQGINVFEFKTFNSALFGLPEADDMSADRGVWKRLNGNTFAYSFMAIAVNETNAILYTARVSGEATLSSDCMSEEITALLEVFWPGNSPFAGEPDYSWQLPVHTTDTGLRSTRKNKKAARCMDAAPLSNRPSRPGNTPGFFFVGQAMPLAA